MNWSEKWSEVRSEKWIEVINQWNELGDELKSLESIQIDDMVGPSIESVSIDGKNKRERSITKRRRQLKDRRSIYSV